MFKALRLTQYKTIALGLTLSSILVFSVFLNTVHANASLQGGDFMQAFNNTTQEGTWRDPVSANPGEIVEFRITAKNNGDEVAHRVQVWGSITGQVPQDPAMTQVITGKISNADFGGQEITDTATVNVLGSTPVGMRYVTGHARLQGVTNLFNCPSACDIEDNVLGGIEVGDIQPGDFVEVTFKAGLVNPPTSSPTPTPTPTNPPVGQTQNQSQNQSQNQTVNVTNTNNNSSSSTSSSSSNTTITTPQVLGTSTTNVKELPKTGLPLAGLALGGLAPLGLRLRKFRSKNTDLDANSIWEEKQWNR